jgi:hypothetical protein
MIYGDYIDSKRWIGGGRVGILRRLDFGIVV